MIPRYMLSTWLTEDVNLEHLAKVVVGRVLH